MQETQVWSLGQVGQEDILAWEIPWPEEPGGLYSPWGCTESDTTERLNTHHDRGAHSHYNGNHITIYKQNSTYTLNAHNVICQIYFNKRSGSWHLLSNNSTKRKYSFTHTEKINT